MNKSIFNRIGIQRIFFRTQSRKSLPIHKRLQRMKRRNKHIYPHIKLIPINQHRITNIFLNNNIISIVKLRQ